MKGKLVKSTSLTYVQPPGGLESDKERIVSSGCRIEPRGAKISATVQASENASDTTMFSPFVKIQSSQPNGDLPLWDAITFHFFTL